LTLKRTLVPSVEEAIEKGAEKMLSINSSSEYENHQLQLELVFASMSVPLTFRYRFSFLSKLKL
jgi:hypothetical protein